MIARGEGCYVYDEHGKRYLDGLSALYCVNVGHGRAELGGAAARAVGQSWPSSRTGATRIRARSTCGTGGGLAPGNLNRVFFTSGRLGGCGAGVEARQGVPRGVGRPPTPQADLSQAGLPRDLDGGSDGDRANAPADSV